MTSTVSLPQATSKKQFWHTDISWFIFLQEKRQTHDAARRFAPGVEGVGWTGSARGDTRENNTTVRVQVVVGQVIP